MKLGIIGLPSSGKTTVFRALTGGADPAGRKGRQDPGVGSVKVEEPRLDFLAHHFKTEKVMSVSVEYLDIAGLTGEGRPGQELGDRVLAAIRPVDAMLHCIRLFDSAVLGAAQPLRDLERVEEEMILSDLAVVERRVDRISRDVKKGRKDLQQELELLEKTRPVLEDGRPLRFMPEVAESDLLRGYAFLSSKPELFLLNVGETRTRDEVQGVKRQVEDRIAGEPHTVVDWLYADAEAEIARLDPEDAREFMDELGLEEGAGRRIIRTSFALLDLIVFFTVIGPEVRAWPLKKGLTAHAAAGTVHSDMQRGFIRAEVISFDDFVDAGSMAAAKKAGKVHLEGKDYVVRDGDILHILFNT